MHDGSLTWRPLDAGDAQASADLLNVIETVDRIGENYTAEDTLTELVDPYADMARGSLAAFDGDVMAGFMKVRFKPSADEVHRVFLDGGVHPAYRRRGLGTTLVVAGVAAASVLHDLHHPTAKLVIDVHKAEHIAGIPELLRAQGFAPIRYYRRMERPLADVPVSAGAGIEPWSSRNDEEFRLIRNESYRDHWGAVPMPPDNWRNKVTNQTFRPELSFLLRDPATGTAMGMLVTLYWEGDTAATGIRDAFFAIVGTLPDHRKRGVASALIGHALRAAADQGYDRASLSVDSANASGAFGLFERAGFAATMRYVRWALEV